MEKPTALEEEEKQLSVSQLAERKERMVFVGNIPLETVPKKVHSHFKECGKIEKIWF